MISRTREDRGLKAKGQQEGVSLRVKTLQHPVALGRNNKNVLQVARLRVYCIQITNIFKTSKSDTFYFSI